MELFHEYKNKYFNLCFKLINLSKDGLTREEIVNIINQIEYDEKLIDKELKTFDSMILNEYEDGNLNLLKKVDDKYYSVLSKDNKIPLRVRFTAIEKSWLKGMLENTMAKSLLGDETVLKISESLKDVRYGSNECIEKTNRSNNLACDEENYEIICSNFYILLKCILNNKVIKYTNVDRYGKEYKDQKALPIRIEYSIRENKFRCSLYSLDEKRSILVNLDKLTDLAVLEDESIDINREDVIEELKKNKYAEEPITLEVEDKRGAMERTFMGFSGYERNSKMLEDNKYEVNIYYYTFEEDDIVRRIMSLGPYVKVKSPKRIRKIIINKIYRAYKLQNDKNIPKS